MAIYRLLFPFIFLGISQLAFSQTEYPKVTAYVGIVHPIFTTSKAATEVNFKDYYLVGFPLGINLWKSDRIGFSLELIPSIKAENGVSKMNNFTVHPGILVKLSKGYTFVGRAAFETSGRYGITPVFNKTLIKNKSNSYYLAIPLPVRFGNDKPMSFSAGIQLGVIF
jgi:hypothetical protein